MGASLPGSEGLSATLYALLVVAGLNTVISLFYYVKVLKVMILEKSLEETEGRPVETIQVSIHAGSYLAFLAVVVLFLGIFWDALAKASYLEGVGNFQPTPTASQVLAATKGGPH